MLFGPPRNHLRCSRVLFISVGVWSGETGERAIWRELVEGREAAGQNSRGLAPAVTSPALNRLSTTSHRTTGYESSTDELPGPSSPPRARTFPTFSRSQKWSHPSPGPQSPQSRHTNSDQIAGYSGYGG